MKLLHLLSATRNLETAQRAAGRLINSGNMVVLAQIPKGLVLWIFESDAQLAKSSTIDS